jgi:hypothetical protein
VDGRGIKREDAIFWRALALRSARLASMVAIIGARALRREFISA